MQMSSDARKRLVESFEGCRLVAYRDAVGVLSVGFGHSSAAGAPHVTPSLCISNAEADAILARDLAKVEAAVSGCLVQACRQREFDAFVDLAFNVGGANFRSSSVVRLFNRNDRAGAANAFLAWNRAGGRVLDGLTKRREAERAWFLGLAKGEPASLGDMAHAVDHPDSLPKRVANRTALIVRKVTS